MSRTLTTIVVLIGSIGSGCLFERGAGSDYTYAAPDASPSLGYAERPLSVRDATLQGSAGEVVIGEPVTARIAYATVSRDGSATLELRAMGRGGALMQLYRIADFPDLAPGDELVVDNVEYRSYDSPPLPAETVGCSGPRDGEWTFDTSADQVVLQVVEGPQPGTLRLNLTSLFDDPIRVGYQSVQGSVVVRLD